MNKQINRFLDTLSFMTTIRVRSGGFDEDFHRAVVFFPTVGLVLGFLYQLIQDFTVYWLGNFTSSVMVIASAAILTGGLHLDGLGDTFDGVYSYRSKDKILEIMKDSRVGTNALLAVIFVVLLKIGFLSRLLDFGYSLVLFMPIAGRTISLLACFLGKPAKSDGSGNVFIGKVIPKDFVLGMGSSLVYFVVFSWMMGGGSLLLMNIIALGGTMLFAIVFMRHIHGRIGGITGDILGALCELGEMVFLFLICLEVMALWNFI